MLRLGVDVRRVDGDDADVIAGSLVKEEISGLGSEGARPEGKAGRGESMDPFQPGERASSGDRWALARWNEYEEAVRDRHRLQRSRGPRARLDMTGERTDDEIVADAACDEVVTELNREESAVVMYIPELGPMIWEAAERDGAAGVHWLLGEVIGALSWADRARIRRWGRGRLRESGWEGAA